jgi:hypothetical protein
MTHTYEVDSNLFVSIFIDGKKVDTVGPYDLKEGAEGWAELICSRYNDPKINSKNVKYPNEIETSELILPEK